MPLPTRFYAGQGLGSRITVFEFNEDDADARTRQIPWESLPVDVEEAEKPPETIPIHRR